MVAAGQDTFIAQGPARYIIILPVSSYCNTQQQRLLVVHLWAISIEGWASGDELVQDHSQAPPVNLTAMPSACAAGKAAPNLKQ
jgi:hypothetical protein